MNLYDEIERIKTEGYSEENAQSKLGQDIVLKAIADSGMARKATIKGGVVMRSLSGDSRRATQDLDLDFIRYSISDAWIPKLWSPCPTDSWENWSSPPSTRKPCR